ncbi:MAG: endolytic transglycosylase MltG, partial [Halanaerobium sp.]
LLIFIIIISAYLWFEDMMLPVNRSNPEEVEIEIKQGMRGKDIAALLEEKGLIKSADLIYYLMRIKQINNLKTGYYTFSTADSPYYILDILDKGLESDFIFTVPEGYTVRQIIDRLTGLDKPTYQAAELESAFDEYAESVEFEENPHLDESVIESAEGLIIPDTYNFPMSYNEDKIARELIDRFKEQRLPLLKEQAEESDFSAYQLLIIASLIEEEGTLSEENKIIASVIYNRLELGQKMQLDATVQYILPERKDRLFYKDLDIDSPYNTYQVEALPPAPIANPGELALEAAINPAETDYLYYFARPDGSHVFTKTYQEHLDRQNELR